VWFFFSLPLVVQQSVVISADTLLNLGAVIATWLFLKSREEHNWGRNAALWVLCIAMIYSKFIVAGVLLLPILLIPYSRIPKLKMLIGVGLVLVVPAVYVLGSVVLAAVRDVGHALNRLAEVNQQVALLGTAEGIRTFFAAVVNYSTEALSFEAWSGPLGWLDTPLSTRHVSLIAASGLLAVFLDTWAYGPQLADLLRSRAREVVLLASVGVAGLLFATVTNAALFFLMTTPVGADRIAGMQIRHFFPSVMVAMMLPLGVLRGRLPATANASLRPAIVADTVALVLFPLLFAARNVELAIDLLTRYWGLDSGGTLFDQGRSATRATASNELPQNGERGSNSSARLKPFRIR
jgi:hypothetical protein